MTVLSLVATKASLATVLKLSPVECEYRTSGRAIDD